MPCDWTPGKETMKPDHGEEMTKEYWESVLDKK